MTPGRLAAMAPASVATALSAVLALLVALAGCQTAGGGALTEVELKNGTYLTRWTQSGAVTLTRGEFRQAVAPGATTATVIRLTDWIVYGDIEGRPAAAVVLVTDPGGSGTFYDLALVERKSGRPQNTALAHLGDRVKVQGLALEEGAIRVDMVAHGPEDPRCCPTQRVRQRYVLQGGRLVQTAETVGAVQGGGTEPAPAITGAVWRWERTVMNDNTTLKPSNPDDYTLELSPDGRVNVRLDCNRGGGTYRLQGKTIAIEILNTTLAACPPESLDQVYLRDLRAVAIYSIKGGELLLDLKFDSGTMHFSRRE